MKKVLIIDDVEYSLITILQHAGLNVHYSPNIPATEVKEQLFDIDILVLRSKLKITKEMIENYAPKLQIIARAGAGLDEIDQQFLSERNITLINAPEGNRQAVAEHLLGMLLSLFNNLNLAHQEIINYQWNREKNRGIELFGKTVGIIGFGNNGKAFAKLLEAFKCKILIHDKYKELKTKEFRFPSDIELIQKEADIISFHTPLTEETSNYLSKEFIEACEKPFWLLNASRGKVAPLENIVWGLKSGKILGAGIDVLENEKFETFTDSQKENFEYLKQHPRVLFSPHVAGWTFESYQKISKVLADKILKILG